MPHKMPRRAMVLAAGFGKRLRPYTDKVPKPLLGDEPFFTVNAKIIWLNGKTDCLVRMAQAFDPDKMDALLLLHSTAQAVGYDGTGDFLMDPFGRLTRRPERQMAPFLYAGIQLCHPRLFRDTPKGAFSTNL